MKALIIKQPWVDLILCEKKVWEIRGRHTHIRGTIGIIESGTGLIVGTVELTDSKPITRAILKDTNTFHCIPEESQTAITYKQMYAWVLQNPIRFKKPKPYIHPKGAIIWVNVPEL